MESGLGRGQGGGVGGGGEATGDFLMALILFIILNFMLTLKFSKPYSVLGQVDPHLYSDSDPLSLGGGFLPWSPRAVLVRGECGGSVHHRPRHQW